MISIVVLSAQMENTKMKSWKLVIKSNVQKQTTKSGFGRKFHDLNYFELCVFIELPWILYITLEVIRKKKM